MDSGKIVLVNLNKGALGDVESRLVGMVLLAKIFSASLGRARETGPRGGRSIFTSMKLRILSRRSLAAFWLKRASSVSP
jgi:hypothetical protein